MLNQNIGTLLGVGIGATLAFIASFLNERAKWKRSQVTRWDERRLNAYVDYLHAIRGMQTLAHRIVAPLGLPSDAEPLNQEDGVPLLIEAEIARSKRWQEVLLLGDKPAIEVGVKLNNCVWILEWFARGRLSGPEDWYLAFEETSRLRRQFLSAARKDLGVTKVNLTRSDWREQWTPEPILEELRKKT